jgi:DNA-binding NarL/FixJ family response regulator
MRTDEQAENATRLSVVVCDDHPIVRHAMKIAVTEAPALSLAAEPVPAADAVVELCKELRPDVCVIGINLGSRPHAIEATRAVRSASPSTKVLALSAYTNDETVLSAIEAGANGFIHKGEPVTSVLQAIVDVGRGRTVIDHDAFPDLVQRALRDRPTVGRQPSHDRDPCSAHPAEARCALRAGGGCPCMGCNGSVRLIRTGDARKTKGNTRDATNDGRAE